MIQFSQDVCTNLDLASQREWLETNGIGGFASSTITGLNTRRYHGLLVAALTPPTGRYVLLSKLEETLLIGDRSYELGTNQYPGVIHPQGYHYLVDFRLDPFPTFSYRISALASEELKGVVARPRQEVELKKTVFLVHGENTVVIEYKLRSPIGGKVTLQLRPLVAFRDYHSLTHENSVLRPTCDYKPTLVSFDPYPDLPPLHLSHNAQSADIHGKWFLNFQYARERERGLDFNEDLFNPCLLTFDLASDSARFIAALQPVDIARATELQQAEIARRVAIRAQSPSENSFVEQLTVASEQFLVDRGEHKSVIAGYHWFSDWGRDTMISLAGLSIAKGRAAVARDILRTFAQRVDHGMLPNRFPDAGEAPEYNTVDATLWFYEAIRAHLARTNDLAFVRDELYAVLADIIDWHIRGTRYNIHVDTDGLLYSGAEGVQLTWMDAKVGNCVVTPRHGKPVEIQALWYNALCIMEDLAGRFGDELGRKRYATYAALARWSFNRLFWNDELTSLYDAVNGTDRDTSLRPNQILAASLHHSMLSAERAKAVVAIVQDHLLTPYGLRTLAPTDPNYRGRYSGDQTSRDRAYHQGTVWPWLLGPFITAYLRVYGQEEDTRRQAQTWLEPLRTHLLDRGTGQISEIFEGDAPHRPVGCIAQAWSIAEVLRVCVDDFRFAEPVLVSRPRDEALPASEPKQVTRVP
jgi:predicted glycogen debranching enzyme